MKKVFISSTCYDLIDVRIELYELFRSMGFYPILSEIGTSDFNVHTNVDSIENCLINVEASDFFVIILDQRYGGLLCGKDNSTGYEDISATHLEYRKARELKKPIFLYVRSNFQADYEMYRKNKEITTKELNWVKDKNYLKLFNLFEEHTPLKKGKHNWYKPFQNSVDLKNIIRSDFKYEADRNNFKKLIEEDKLPYFSINTEVIEKFEEFRNCYRFHFVCNKQVIYDFKIPKFKFYRDIQSQNIKVIVPDSGTSIDIILDLQKSTHKEENITIQYRTATGFLIKDHYVISTHYNAPVLVLQNREYCTNDVKSTYTITEDIINDVS